MEVCDVVPDAVTISPISVCMLEAQVAERRKKLPQRLEIYIYLWVIIIFFLPTHGKQPWWSCRRNLMFHEHTLCFRENIRTVASKLLQSPFWRPRRNSFEKEKNRKKKAGDYCWIGREFLSRKRTCSFAVVCWSNRTSNASSPAEKAARLSVNRPVTQIDNNNATKATKAIIAIRFDLILCAFSVPS